VTPSLSGDLLLRRNDRSWEENPARESYYPPSGREVVYRDGIFVGYRGYDHDGKKPLFPFGYGLSYTKFEYSQLTLKATGRDDRDPRYEVSFNVKNTAGPARRSRKFT
jgi:beta-glucosidase